MENCCQMASRCGTPARRILTGWGIISARPPTRLTNGNRWTVLRPPSPRRVCLRLGNYVTASGDEQLGGIFRRPDSRSQKRFLMNRIFRKTRNIRDCCCIRFIIGPNGWDYIAPGKRCPMARARCGAIIILRELALMLLREARGETYLTFFDCSTRIGVNGGACLQTDSHSLLKVCRPIFALTSRRSGSSFLAKIASHGLRLPRVTGARGVIRSMASGSAIAGRSSRWKAGMERPPAA